MRHQLLAALMLLAAPPYAGTGASEPPAKAVATSQGADAAAVCTAQRAENRDRAAGARCTSDQECVQAGQYETGSCDSWVTKPDAEELLRQMRVSTESACRDVAQVLVTPACPAVVGACVSGRCTAKPLKDSTGVVDKAVPAVPEDFQCVATALRRVTSEKKLPGGKVSLRFPLAPDGRPPWFFEAIGRHDPETAVGAARAFGWCRWRLKDGGPIKPGAWGTMSLMLTE
jgi:hypothetical protein